jgi:geranylgeranyl reductase family protein
MTELDVIVVGAGPAGACAAIHCARAGLRVGLLDKASFPRDKTCGDAVLPPALAILDELGLLGELRRLPHAARRTLAIGGETGRFDVPLPADVIVCRRRDFDNLLFVHASRLAHEVLAPFSVSGLLMEDGRVRGVRGSAKGGGEVELRSKLVIGADGANSIVARLQGMQPDEREWLVATREYYAGVDAEALAGLDFNFLDECAPGYFWIFPAGAGITNVGVGVARRSLKEKGLSLRALHARMLAAPRVRELLGGAKPVEKLVAWNLPVAMRDRQRHGAGVLLCGDAAGVINPLWGDGIDTAMFSGKLAAEHAARAVAAGAFTADDLAGYSEDLWKSLGPRFAFDTHWRGQLEALRPGADNRVHHLVSYFRAIPPPIVTELPR